MLPPETENVVLVLSQVVQGMPAWSGSPVCVQA